MNVVAVRGSYGSDTVKGADNGDFSIDGGGDRVGLDTLDYSGLSGAVTVIYGRASVSGPLAGTVSKSGGNDTFVNIDQVLGTSGGDDLIGTPDPTAASAIRLHGEAGNDYIDGAKSTANVADYTDSPGAVVVHLQDYVSGSNAFGDASDGWGGTDTLVNVRAVYGSLYNDTIIGSDQNDLIQGGYGNNSIDAGAGLDTAIYWCSKAAATSTSNNNGRWSVTTPSAPTPSAMRDPPVQGRHHPTSARRARLQPRQPLRPVVPGHRGPSPSLDHERGDSHRRLRRCRHAGRDIQGGRHRRFQQRWQHRHPPGGRRQQPRPVDDGLYRGRAGRHQHDGDRGPRCRNHGEERRRLQQRRAMDALLQSSNRTVSLLGSADGTTYKNTDVTVLSNTWSPAGYADFDGNHTNDILWKDNAGNLNIWYFGAGGIVDREFLTKLSGTWSVAGVGDFNGDLKADLLLVDGSGNLKVETMNGRAITGEALLGALPAGWSIAQILDVDGDGKADIISKHAVGTTTEWDVTYVAKSIAAGTFTHHALGTLASNAGWQLV